MILKRIVVSLHDRQISVSSCVCVFTIIKTICGVGVAVCSDEIHNLIIVIVYSRSALLCKPKPRTNAVVYDAA